MSRGFALIKVNSKFMGTDVPGYVYRHPPFAFQPKAFMLESPKLDGRIIAASAQQDSLNQFEEDPRQPMVYVVTGNPDDVRALYFAAYLAQIHKRYVQNATIVWEPVYASWDNPGLKYSGLREPSMIVLTNLAENSTNFKLERAKDMMARWPSIPRVIVAAGEDPISFGSTKLHVPCNGIAYFGSSMVKSVNQII